MSSGSGTALDCMMPDGVETATSMVGVSANIAICSSLWRGSMNNTSPAYVMCDQ